MSMNLFQNLIMGFISGLTELLPISAEAHRSILRLFFGIETEDVVFRFLVHIACLIAVILMNRNIINRIRQTRHLMKVPSRRRNAQPNFQSVYTIRLLQTATILMVILKLFTPTLSFIQDHMNFLAIPLLLNGILLILPALTRTGNKDSRNMPRLDGFLMGLGAGLSVLPGVSAIGACASIGMARGVDRKFALRFSYLMLIRVLIVDIVFDSIAIAVSGVAFTTMGLLFAALGAVLAGLGAALAIKLMNFMASANGFSGFAYYSWGIGLFCFILFLTV